MAKTVKQPDIIRVRYDLHDLPTAQHKAGLAGLLLQIENMNERRQHGGDLTEPPKANVGETYAEVHFTAKSVQALFDDLYDADLDDAAVAQKWAGKEPKEVREVEVRDKTGKIKKEKRFVYEVTKPRGAFLARYMSEEREVWHKLWRDMLWTVTRGRPTTRGPFNERAAGKSTREGGDAWKRLLALNKAKAKGMLPTEEVAGAVMLGAQAVSAEGVGFEDRVDHALLLHFWQLTARIFVPEQIDREGKREFVGYVLAIPEVRDLPEFMNAYKHWLSFLKADAQGYRPAAAVISIAAEGSLAFMNQLDRLAGAKEARQHSWKYLAGVEFFHMVKLRNNIKTATHGRISADPELLREYEYLVGEKGPKNPLMRAGRIRALLEKQPWFFSLGDALVEREWSWFVHSTKEGHRTPPAMLGFARDARRFFKVLVQEEKHMSQANEKTPLMDDPEAVDRVVYRLVRSYVREKASARLGFSTDNRDEWYKSTHDPATGYERPAYQEKRRDIAGSLFLALRSRHDVDFVEHFTATLGSIAQRLPERDYLVLAGALMRTFTDEQGAKRPRTRDDVKTLTLLALSAQSRSLSAAAEETAPSTAEQE